MPYNSLVNRADVESLIPEEASREILKNVPANSIVMQYGRRLQNMARNQRRMPVLSLLPTGYFVTAETGVGSIKQTTEVNWANKYLDAEEIAVIIPIPESVLDDVDYDIWAEIRPLIEEEFGRVFDAAVLFGTNKPATWPSDLVTAAAAAGNSLDYSDLIGAGKDLYDILMGEAGLLQKVEDDGFLVDGHIAGGLMKARLRGLRHPIWNGSALVPMGSPMFQPSMKEAGTYELDGAPLKFPVNGAWDSATALMLSGDWTKLVYSLRQDITYKILDQAVIMDNTGAIVYNLPQQDMIALRATLRLAFQVANPINRLQPVEANRYPFAVLVP